MIYQGILENIIVDRQGFEVVCFDLKASGMSEAVMLDTFLKKEHEKGDCTDHTMVVTDNRESYKRWKSQGYETVPLKIGLAEESPYVIEDIEEHEPATLEGIFLRLKGLPWHILKTQRLLIREITLDDLPRLYEIYGEAQVAAYVDPLYEDIEEEREYTRKYIRNCYGFFEYGTWILEDRDRGTVIGRAGLEPLEDRTELGYVIAREYQGQGIATECCQAIMRLAEQLLPGEPIWARCRENNEASKRILHKLGFEEIEKNLRNDPNESFLRFVYKR